MESDLLETLRNAARRLFRGGPLLAAYAFGSRVAGRPLPDSDLDVGYYLRGYRRRAQLPLREEMVLAAELTAAATGG